MAKEMPKGTSTCYVVYQESNHDDDPKSFYFGGVYTNYFTAWRFAVRLALGNHDDEWENLQVSDVRVKEWRDEQQLTTEAWGKDRVVYIRHTMLR